MDAKTNLAPHLPKAHLQRVPDHFLGRNGLLNHPGLADLMLPGLSLLPARELHPGKKLVGPQVL